MSTDIKRLFQAHHREIHAYLTRKLGNTEIAADLTQETFLRFAQQRAISPATPILHERSYLYRSAHNLAVDHLHRQCRERTDLLPDDDLAEVPDGNPTPEEAVGDRDELALVRAVILELPERTRQIFMLARIEGLTYREVALRLRISESSVQKHLAKATKQVMQRLRVS